MVDLRVLLFAFIPQDIATFYVSLVIFGIRINLWKLIIFGSLYGLFDFLGKIIFMKYGIDLLGNIIPIVYSIIVIRYIFKVRIGIAITTSIMGLVLQFISTLIAQPLATYSGIDMNGLFDSNLPWNIVLGAFIINIPLFILVIIEKFTKFTVIDFGSREGNYLD